MEKKLLGYEFLREQFSLSAFPLSRPARVAHVVRVTPTTDWLEIPAAVAPASDDPLLHILFALKHEGVNLQVLSQSVPKIDSDRLTCEICKNPSSKYLRITAYLWEYFTGINLTGIPAASGPYVSLFDEKKYLTGTVRRNTKWRVDFNGLGSIWFCPTVERSESIDHLLMSNTLERTRNFTEGIGRDMLERTMSWSYLSETESSFAIERETTPSNKAETFAELLKHAHEKTPVTEDYLVALQNLTVTNAFDRDNQFRTKNNWLRSSGRGVLGITYVPPSQELVPKLMDAIMDMVNETDLHQSPLVIGSIVSFAFVFVHPFMDGNGRLSRFLFHKAVCQSGILKQGLVLPISTAIKRNEDEYLSALKSFSVPARKLWDVLMVDDENFEFKFKGDSTIYRYFNATPCVEFGLKMAEEAFQYDLQNEVDYLVKYDKINSEVNKLIDLNSNTLSLLIRLCIQGEGSLSKGKRKSFVGKGYTNEMLDAVESIATRVLCEKRSDDEKLE